MTYYIYHIPGKKIGVTRDLKYRVEEQQGYGPGEYEVLMESDDILQISKDELILQEIHGYRIDETPYNELKFNKEENEMNINITEATTTFPCPVNKLKGQLMDKVGMTWQTNHGDCMVTSESIKWILKNIQTSRYNSERCYVYNKAMARWFDNNDPYNGKTIAGGLMNDRLYGEKESYECCDENTSCECMAPSQFDLIREWADERGLYENGDTKTQALKLVEEVGETCRAILKEDFEEVVDGIGDCVVVLTNLAELQGVSIEVCIAAAYEEIKNRKGKMANGTYVKQ